MYASYAANCTTNYNFMLPSRLTSSPIGVMIVPMPSRVPINLILDPVSTAM